MKYDDALIDEIGTLGDVLAAAAQTGAPALTQCEIDRALGVRNPRKADLGPTPLDDASGGRRLRLVGDDDARVLLHAPDHVVDRLHPALAGGHTVICSCGWRGFGFYAAGLARSAHDAHEARESSRLVAARSGVRQLQGLVREGLLPDSLLDRLIRSVEERLRQPSTSVFAATRTQSAAICGPTAESVSSIRAVAGAAKPLEFVSLSTDGAAAVASVVVDRPDLLFIGEGVGGIGVQDVIRLCRACHPGLKVIVIQSRSDGGIRAAEGGPDLRCPPDVSAGELRQILDSR